MKHIPARLSAEQALRWFEARQRFRRLRQWLLGRVRNSRLPHIELAWLPYYIIPFEVRSSRGPGVIAVSVEGFSGAFAIFQMHPDIAEGLPDGEVYRPSLSEEEATLLGRERLFQAVLHKRGNRGKPVPHAALAIEVVHFPYWVYYFERRKGSIDIRLLNAATGERPGHKTKLGMLEAFAQADRSRPTA